MKERSARTYTVPFDMVWQTTLRLARHQRRWTLLHWDDREGRIVAEARRLWARTPDDVRIRVGLDRDGQTYVDLSSAARSKGPDLGANARRIRRFLRRLDEEVGGGSPA